MTIREMRLLLGDTQREFSLRYHIPFRTIQNWESGARRPPVYVVELLSERVLADKAKLSGSFDGTTVNGMTKGGAL